MEPAGSDHPWDETPLKPDSSETSEVHHIHRNRPDPGIPSLPELLEHGVNDRGAWEDLRGGTVMETGVRTGSLVTCHGVTFMDLTRVKQLNSRRILQCSSDSHDGKQHMRQCEGPTVLRQMLKTLLGVSIPLKQSCFL